MFARRTEWNLNPNRFSAALEEAKRAGKKLTDLTASNPTEVGLEYDRAGILKALSRPEALVYEPDPRGLLSAREAVAGYYADRGANVSPEQIILTTSTSEAYSFLFRLLCDPGDEVLIALPSYPLFDLLAGIQDVKLASYPLFYDHGWHIDVHALESAVSARTRAVLVVHPNNPTGSFVSESERLALLKLCGKKELALIADEVFLDFAHPGTTVESFAREQQLALTFTLSGLSKITALPQLKLAWLVASGPAESRERAMERLEVIADTYLSVNAPIQHALPDLLKIGVRLRDQLGERIAQNLAELDQQLAGQKSCQRLAIQGGWYAVLRVPAVQSDEDLALRLLEEHDVVVHPGHFYDFPQEGYLIVSLITPLEDFAASVRKLLRGM
ncbi:MAG: pyridoxal phosphate-dependent aminotransferase [Terriglobales bacterium]|jgi:alanine-synthesizing transaminase